MKIQTLILGMLDTNCYVLTADDSSKDCIIIDTGLDAEPLVQLLKQQQLVPQALILTHGHVDHIAGINDLRQNWPQIKVIVHKDDADMLPDSVANLSTLVGVFFQAAPADIIIDTEDTLEFAGLSLKVLLTPGHTPGGISLYCPADNVIFDGDVLFSGSIGRTDFPGGDFDTLIASIKQQLLTLPVDTTVYPGHGPSTTIEYEIRYHQYLA